VILKLGEVRVHHFAHLADVDCEIARPESALHLNVKMHLANELARGRALVVAQQCLAPLGICDHSRQVELLFRWDEGTVG
jgi:competence CoiA-like predicted nuclease